MAREILWGVDCFRGGVKRSESKPKSSSYSFKVPTQDSIDWQRIDTERWEDAKERGNYSSDAFLVSYKDLGCVALAISADFLKRFERADDIVLCYQPFCWDHAEGRRWGQDYGIQNAHYRYYFIKSEDVGKVKAQLAEIRKIHKHRFSVNVTSV